MIQAITNQQVGLNVITELIIGYALPGKPIAMMMFKTWGFITMAQALQFTSDFKLGHYMKLPPRTMFWGQILATVIAGTTQLGVQSWMFTNIKDMCSPTQPDGFICPYTEVFGTASIVWGVIGPQRQFSKGQIYYGILTSFVNSVHHILNLVHGRAFILLPCWFCCSFPDMAHRTTMAQFLAPLRQLARHPLWRKSHSACQRCQLCTLGNRRFHLPIYHP